MTEAYSLSAEQAAAVECDEPAIVVVASAGSGKTEVAARRVERLLSETPDKSFRILALSYTIKAADELRERLHDRLGQLYLRVEADTVHGFAHSLLRQHGTRIGLLAEPEVLARDADRVELLSRWYADSGRSFPEAPDALLRRIDLDRARLKLTPLVEDWHAALQSIGAIDFGSMLLFAQELVALNSTSRQMSRLYGHVIIDEAQNLTPAQYAFITTLIGRPSSDRPHIATMIIGDDKQSIVSFAGADPNLIRRFETDYAARRFELTINYRSAEAIITVGNSVADRLGQAARIGQPPRAYAVRGVVELREAEDELDEARTVTGLIAELRSEGMPSDARAASEESAIALEDIVVLARSSAALRQIQNGLERDGFDTAVAIAPDDWLSTIAGKVAFEIISLYSAADHSSTHWQLSRLLEVEPEQVNSIAHLEATLRGSPDGVLRAISAHCRVDEPSAFIEAIGNLDISAEVDENSVIAWDSDCQLLRSSWSAFVSQVSAAEQTWGNFRLHVFRQQRGDDLDRGIRLLTVHKAQGREFKVVCIVGMNEGQFPDFRATSETDRLAELRTFYVAVSRASRMLILTRARSRQTRYGSRRTEPSTFLRFLE